MSKIGIDVIQRMQSASIGHFKDSLGVIVYNNKKLKSNPLTKDASTWHQKTLISSTILPC
ncbi:18205_t:CDS:2 [Dentiscutata erythropus]|uniref:18205_t:CDS:1 n=1 Tax=Dentiscutata erythropus TaxID=1348616 RepID=A0A9N9K0K6_9GLOM|nr:18205_t:CDS:2 [Dentiscutata erythropus]